MTASPLERGLEAYRRQAWSEAFEALSIADRSTPLLPDDLWLLATSALLIGRGDDYLALLERAHRAFLERGEVGRATRCAFWLSGRLAERGDLGRPSGWGEWGTLKAATFALSCGVCALCSSPAACPTPAWNPSAAPTWPSTCAQPTTRSRGTSCSTRLAGGAR